MVRNEAKLLAKVVCLDGDMDRPRLGLSEQQLAQLLDETNVVLHCAANIVLEPHVHDTLRTK